MKNSILVEGLENQPLLYFPPDFLQQFPAHFVVEYRNLTVNTVELQLVEPNTPARSRRYKVVRHNGAAWTSVPRPWLRDINAKKGDEIDVMWLGSTAILAFRRHKA